MKSLKSLIVALVITILLMLGLMGGTILILQGKLVGVFLIVLCSVVLFACIAASTDT